MSTLSLHRMQKGMSYEKCLTAIADGIIGLVFELPEISDEAKKLLPTSREPYGIISMLDAMEIYGNDLADLISRVCKKDRIKFITIIWAFELGAMYNLKYNYCKLDYIKNLITDARKGIEIDYPYTEAQALITSRMGAQFPIESLAQ